MSRVFETYRAIHDQAFVPLFVRDDRDTSLLVDACMEAGCRVIEYTLRRPDAHAVIPALRRRFPELHILVGSTLDDDGVVRQAQRLHPQMRTLSELADMGVDGFVSLVGWNPESIRKYGANHVVIPAAMTVNEAYQQFVAGAHYIKLIGPDVSLARLCRNPATFEFCPVFMTGGMTPDRIPEAVSAGAVVIGSGFDLMLRDSPGSLGASGVSRLIREYISVTQETRKNTWPRLAAALGSDRRSWLACLPHHHPFGDLPPVGKP